MEPERKIEKLLRAAAKKRREETGDPLELHAANRRLFHGEVARQFRRPEARDARWSILGELKRRWVASLSAVALLAILAAILFPALNKSKRQAEYASAPTAASRSRSVSELQVAAPAVDSPVASSEELDKGKPQVAATIQVASPPAARFSASNREKLPAEPLGSASLNFVPSNQIDGQLLAGNAGSLEEAPKALALNAPAVAKSISSDAAGFGGSVFSATNGLTDADGNRPAFDNTLAQKESTSVLRRQLSQDAGQKLKAISNQLPVLTAFEVTRDGSEIRIVDNDGSVYRGTLRERESMTGLPIAVDSGARSEVVDRLDSSAHDHRLGVAAGAFFQVTGTNRTLNRSVVLSGELSFATNQQSGNVIGATVSPEKPAAGAAGFQLLPIASLQGRLIIGNGGELSIEAKPAVSTNR